MNILATINTGDFMCQNVRDSLQDAARRWGCQYVEITERFAKADHPYAMKLELPLYKWGAHARVFFVEGDILIRDDCPSPFDVVEPGCMGVVYNDQGELDGEATKLQRAAWESVNGAFKEFWNKMAIPYTGQYWNTGVFMFESRHAPAFAWASELFEVLKPYGADDQTILSMAIQNFKMPIHILDRRWNCVGPVVWKSAPNLPAWITHYAKYADHRRDRDAKLKTGLWKVTQPPMLNERNGVGELAQLLGG